MEKEFDLLAKFDALLVDLAAKFDPLSCCRAPIHGPAAPTLFQFDALTDVWAMCQNVAGTQVESASDPIELRVLLLCGDILAEISMPRESTVQELCEILAERAPATPVCRLRLAFEDQVLPKHATFSAPPLRHLCRADLQLIRMCSHSFELDPPHPMAGQKDYDVLYKALIVGDSGTGKSVLVNRLCNDEYADSSIATIGVDFKIRTLVADATTCVKLQIWDTAGGQRFRTITSSYYRGAHAILLVFDVTDRATFDALAGFVDDIRKHSKVEDVLVLLVGSKAESSDERQVEENEGNTFALEHGMAYSEVDAKTGFGVQQLLFNMTGQLLDQPQRKRRSQGFDCQAATSQRPCSCIVCSDKFDMNK